MELSNWRSCAVVLPLPILRGLEGIGLRLAFMLPLTPWPALRLIQAQGEYSTGRHGADALAPVMGHACTAGLAVHLAGLILLLLCRRDRSWPLSLWVVFALVNGFCMWMYIESNGIFYC